MVLSIKSLLMPRYEDASTEDALLAKRFASSEVTT